MNINMDTARLYSAQVTKLNRNMKPDSRVYVLCDLHFYRLDSSYSMKKKAPIEIGQILRLSISPGDDQAIVIHCSVSALTYEIMHFCVNYSVHIIMLYCVN